MKQKIHRDGWATAMAPMLIATALRDKHVSFADKLCEARLLRAEVDAHIASGGAFEVLPSYSTAGVNA